jgi:chromatin segregation and condensation protein Rec8/ScpA/Scc1 (kleisin family)
VQNRQRRVVDDEPRVDDVDDLKDCHEKVERLREEKQELEVENEVLRESADTFGELAERLNKKIKNESGD